MTTLIIMIFVVGYLCIVMETSGICWRIVQARVVASLSLVQRQVLSSWGLERISFVWYLRHFSLLAFIGYLAGMLVYWFQNLW